VIRNVPIPYTSTKQSKDILVQVNKECKKTVNLTPVSERRTEGVEYDSSMLFCTRSHMVKAFERYDASMKHE